jgi:hypothetical protein
MIVPFDIYFDDKEYLEKVYHKGQEKIWDGRKTLDDLLEKYPNLDIDNTQATALKNILAIILWGEYVAWNVSSEMSAKFVEQGPKMAAVSQAHDEARHFYVMKDYLEKRLNYKPETLFKAALRVLEEVSNTNCMAKKLLGLQLMIEPVAITIFRFVRKSNIDPILSELLEYYEKDEARHIALGVKYLPSLIKKMSFLKKVSFVMWQIRLILFEIKGLKCIEKDLEALGINPREVFEFAENKQISCLKEVSSQMGIGERIWKPVIKIIDISKRLAFYPDRDHSVFKKVFVSVFR